MMMLQYMGGDPSGGQCQAMRRMRAGPSPQLEAGRATARRCVGTDRLDDKEARIPGPGTDDPESMLSSSGASTN
jgi:hypothetical protein